MDTTKTIKATMTSPLLDYLSPPTGELPQVNHSILYSYHYFGKSQAQHTKFVRKGKATRIAGKAFSCSAGRCSNFAADFRNHRVSVPPNNHNMMFSFNNISLNGQDMGEILDSTGIITQKDRSPENLIDLKRDKPAGGQPEKGPTNFKSSDDVLRWLEERMKESQEEQDLQAAKEQIKMFLPGLEEAMRAIPNHVARSSLFAPVARGRRQFHEGAVLVSRSDACLEYWGLQLNELHADIMLQLLFEARKFPLGTPVRINRNQFLKSLGWGNSGAEYNRFHRYMKDLTASMLVIEAKYPDGRPKYKIGRTETFRIVEKFSCDDEGENYSYILDPRWMMMYRNREYALLDWDKRLQIGQGQDMAKALQRLFATSDTSPQRYALDWLKEKMQFSSPMRKFRESLRNSMNELKRIMIIDRWKLELNKNGNEQLTAWIKK